MDYPVEKCPLGHIDINTLRYKTDYSILGYLLTSMLKYQINVLSMLSARFDYFQKLRKELVKKTFDQLHIVSQF